MGNILGLSLRSHKRENWYRHSDFNISIISCLEIQISKIVYTSHSILLNTVAMQYVPRLYVNIWVIYIIISFIHLLLKKFVIYICLKIRLIALN